MKWYGVMPAMTTCLDETLQVDASFMTAHARWLLDNGCTGIVSLGSLGQAATLTFAEKEAILRNMVAAVADRAPVVAAISALSTEEAVALAKSAEMAGCSGLMVLPPYVYRGDWREMKAHVTAVFGATPLSCMLYNNPVAYGTDFLPEQIAELANEYENLAAVKESSTDVRRVTAIRALLGDRLQVFVGVDDAIVEGIAAGAVGWVAGLVNAFPAESVALFNSAIEGKHEEAFALYRWFLPLLRMDTVPKFVQLIHQVQQETGTGNARVRAPRLEVTGVELEATRAVVAEALRNRPAVQSTPLSQDQGAEMELKGVSLIAGRSGAEAGAAFRALNPETGEWLEPEFFSATAEDVDATANEAQDAVARYGALSAHDRAAFLRAIADGLDAVTEDLAERAQRETALPRARLQGEVKRASNQFRLFAGLVEEGSWVSARIDTALPERKPAPRPDLRSMLRPLGPVAVFGASNFPIAFSVAGGDTASALAAGNPVVVKAHPAHPGTSEIAGRVIADCVHACGLPAGVFSLLFDAGIEVGKALVEHPAIKAVGFTGSHAAGRALMNLAAARPDPIPCFAEMSSANPVFILPHALRERSSQLAAGLYSSFTLGAGQFCTKPGLVFLPQQTESEAFLDALRELTAGSAGFTLLTAGIAAKYRKALIDRKSGDGVEVRTAMEALGQCAAQAALIEVEIDRFLADSTLSEEIFGPSTLVIRYGQRDAMLQAAEGLDGHLTATLLGSPEDLRENRDLIAILERKAGRVIFNGFPTGVEVSHAMVHGGPYPAASDSRFTSVGSQAILRFARPVCYQGFPGEMLPEELRDGNPLQILRMVNGTLTREQIAG